MYSNERIYFGDIVKVENGKEIVLSSEEWLTYNEDIDNFYKINSEEKRNLLMSIFDEMNGHYVPDEEYNKLKEIYDKASLPYKEHGIEGEVFVKTSSLSVYEPNKRGRK